MLNKQAKLKFMKKLKLKLGADGALTREQLKKVIGGVLGSGGDCPQNECGGSAGTCASGSCHSATCPKDKNFTYNYCG